MTQRKVLVKALEAAARSTFIAAGFRRHGTVFATDIGPDVVFRVGLSPSSKRDGTLGVMPSIGVHHISLHKLLAELNGYQYDPEVSDLGLGLPAVIPGKPQFVMETEDDAAPVVKAIVDGALEYGLPRLRQYATLHAIVEALPTFPGLPPRTYREYLMPTGLYLLGRDSEALVWLAAAEGRLASNHPMVRAEYAAFASGLRQRLRPE